MIADHSAMSFPSIREQFLATFLRQSFVLPDSMIYYIIKNQKSSKVYQKLIQSCKYFFLKNPILIFHCLQIDDNGWKTCSNQSDCEALSFNNKINITKLSGCKIWIQKKLRIYSTNPSCASALIPAIFQCDAEKLWLNNQQISFQQLLLCFRNLKYINLKRVMVYSYDCIEVPLEEIVTNLPTLERIIFEYAPESKNVTSDTVKNLLQIPHFKNIKQILLDNISEKFDVDTFYCYYKAMKTIMHFRLDYQNLLSDDYAAKLARFIKDILSFDRTPPKINYPGQDIYDLCDLLCLCEKFPLCF